MQGLQRQFCYQSAQIQKKTNKYQNLLSKTHHSIKAKVERKGLIMFRRCDYKSPLKQYPDILEETRNDIQSQKMDQVGQKFKKIKGVRRHTFYSTDTKDVKDKQQKQKNSIFLSQKSKPTIFTQQATMYSQQFNKTKLGWKYKDKNTKISEHIENEKQQPANVKKRKKMKQTKLPVIANGEQIIFLSLMKKFRFQNLKTADVREGVESSFQKQHFIVNQNRQRSLNSFKVFKQELSLMEEERQKATFYHKTQTRDTRNDKRVGKLTPWQITDQIQFYG